jgi:xanthosine utilization system XapX-like protein
MLLRFGKATVVFGWFLILVGIVYVAIGIRDAVGGIPGSLARMLVGLVAVVVGSSIVRWARRARPDQVGKGP